MSYDYGRTYIDQQRFYPTGDLTFNAATGRSGPPESQFIPVISCENSVQRVPTNGDVKAKEDEDKGNWFTRCMIGCFCS